jgi:hypothetical protein
MAAPDDKKMLLEAADAAKIEAQRSQAVSELMNPEEPTSNVVGVASGVKWRNDEPTGEPAVVVLVTQKVDKGDLPPSDVVATKIDQVKTDVVEIGYPVAEQFWAAPPQQGLGQLPRQAMDGAEFAQAPAQGPAMLEEQELLSFAEAQLLRRRLRPAEGGYSIAHIAVTAGTIGTCVYDILPGGLTGTSPAHGLGIPPRTYILSNNHVLANSNVAQIGDAVLQPGPLDGGVDPSDRIATLARFIPLALEPPIPRIFHRNLVDAALAHGQFHDLDREIYWIGYVEAWRRRSNVMVGTVVQKTGRTTNFTTGRITAINATVDVGGYTGGRVGRFFDQIILTNMSAPGDSGSLIVTQDGNVAVGLLFAGSAVATIANQIENVRSLLRVEVAERIG